MSDIRSANVGQELRRPLPLALLALALLGWIVAIWAIASNASSTRSYTARIEAVERDRATADQKFAELRRARAWPRTCRAASR